MHVLLKDAKDKIGLIALSALCVLTVTMRPVTVACKNCLLVINYVDLLCRYCVFNYSLQP
jgi:hypothetical protein